MIELQAQLRPEKTNPNQIRKQGFVPAILYGPKIKNIEVMSKEKDLNKAYLEAGESTLLKLKIKDQKDYLVLIHDLQKDPVHDQITHIDFYQPRLDKAIMAEVPLTFVGQPEAVTVLGGMLLKNLHQVEVEALPQDLPREIEVDVSSLKTFDDIIHVRDLKLAEGVKINAEADEVVALVEAPRTEAELEALEEKAEEKPEEVAVEGEEKKEGAEAKAETREEPKEETKEESKE